MSEIPFRDELIKSDLDSTALHEFRHDPSKIIRQHNLSKLDERHRLSKLDYYLPDKSKEKVMAEELDIFNATKKELRELSEVYGINVVPTDMVLGRNERGFIVMYTITERLSGQSLEKRLASPESVPIAELESFYIKLANYLEDKGKRNEPYLWDIIHNSQYVYRDDVPNDQEHIYLVDVDPHLSNPSPEEDNTSSTIHEFFKLALMISSAEDKIGKQLEKPRQKIYTFLQHLPSSSNQEHKKPGETTSIEALQRFITGQKDWV